MPPPPDREAQRELLRATSWLLDLLAESPRLVRDVRAEAKMQQIPPALLRRAAQALPIVRRPRELRGPWMWMLPEPEELVRVQYECPVTNCHKVSEGWMQFRMSRLLFAAGLLRYLTRGTARRTQPPDGETFFLRLDVEASESSS